MLLMHALPDTVVLEQLFRAWEETTIFVFGVVLEHPVPRQAIAHEAGLVCVHNVWRLLIDAVEASEDGIVHAAHMAGTSGEEIMLNSSSAIDLQALD